MGGRGLSVEATNSAWVLLFWRALEWGPFGRKAWNYTWPNLAARIVGLELASADFIVFQLAGQKNAKFGRNLAPVCAAHTRLGKPAK